MIMIMTTIMIVITMMNMILMIMISNTVTDWFHESFVFESRRSGETPRRGGQLRDSDERLRIASYHIASHATNKSSPAETDAESVGARQEKNVAANN